MFAYTVTEMAIVAGLAASLAIALAITCVYVGRFQQHLREDYASVIMRLLEHVNLQYVSTDDEGYLRITKAGVNFLGCMEELESWQKEI